VILTLLTEIRASKTTQLVVDKRQDGLKRVAVSIPPVEEEFADLPGGSRTHVGVSGHGHHRDDAGRIVKSPSNFNAFYSIP
jgi:hypothetical protein